MSYGKVLLVMYMYFLCRFPESALQVNRVEGRAISNDVIARVRLDVILWSLDVGLGYLVNAMSVKIIYIYMYTENSTGNLLIYEPFMAYI